METSLPTVRDLVERYLQLGMDDLSPANIEHKRRILGGFAEVFGTKTIAELRAIDIATWLAGHTSWRSAWTFNGALAAIRRLFNWSIEMELCERNPSQRVKLRRKNTRRLPMTDEHFQTLMRYSDPIFRRILVTLKFTGARPAELTSTRWRDVRFEQRAIVLGDHKTAKKTGRPRVIPLVPPILKLLAWMRSHRQASVVGLVERFLLAAGGQMKAVELARKMKPYGVSYRAVAQARTALGVEKVWVAGPGRAKASRPNRKTPCDPWRDLIAARRAAGCGVSQIYDELKTQGYTGTRAAVKWAIRQLQRTKAPAQEPAHYAYRLPADYQPLPDPSLHDFVFANALGNQFNKHSLANRMQRMRKRAGLPKYVTLYQLRHRFFLQGIKNRVNLKLLSLAGGHARTQMTEHYIHEAGLTEDVYEGAIQAVYGPGAVAAIKPPPPPRPIEVITPPPVEEIPIVAEYVPSRANTERERPQVRVQRDEPTNGTIETLLNELLNRLPTPKMNGRHGGPALILPLRPAEAAAWQAYQWALAEDPALAAAKDGDVFAWLKSRKDCPHALPPLADTFRRYLSKGRLFYDQRKRVLRGRELPPAPQDADQEGGAA
jgi:integrase